MAEKAAALEKARSILGSAQAAADAAYLRADSEKAKLKALPEPVLDSNVQVDAALRGGEDISAYRARQNDLQARRVQQSNTARAAELAARQADENVQNLRKNDQLTRLEEELQKARADLASLEAQLKFRTTAATERRATAESYAVAAETARWNAAMTKAHTDALGLDKADRDARRAGIERNRDMEIAARDSDVTALSAARDRLKAMAGSGDKKAAEEIVGLIERLMPHLSAHATRISQLEGQIKNLRNP